MNRQPLTPIARYGPMGAVVVVLALLLLIAPSKSPDRTNAFAGGFDTGATRGAGDASTATAVSGSSDTGQVSSGADGTQSATAGQATSNASAHPTAPAATAGGRITGEDCARRAFFGPSYTCMPLWEGDNGGATYKGVTDKALTVVYYQSKPNPAVDAVLAGGGLSSTPEERAHEIEVYTKWFQQRTQTYGRTIDMKIFNGNADAGDAAGFRADAVKIDQELHAALVLNGNDVDFIDELARRGISCICGAQLPGKYHRDHAPFVFGILPDGDTTNEHLAEFICRRLGPGSKADFSGDVIHPTIGRRGEVVRRYGMAYPNGYWGVNNAKDLEARLAAQCGIKIAAQVGYASDINTAEQQSTANTQTSIREKITTVICVCDPLAPIFGTNSATQQQWYPEWLVTGYLLIDADALARLYDKSQWPHAFGVSSLAPATKKEDATWYRAWKEVEPDTEPNAAAAPIIFPYIQVAMAGIELAGPKYDPRTFAQGMFAIDTKSTDKYSVTFGYSPDDYGGIDDFREIWWSPDDTDIDGNSGTYLGVDDHHRWLTGQWPTSPTKVFKRECLGPHTCGEP